MFNIPTSSEIDNGLRKFRELDWSNISLNEIPNKVEKCILNIPLIYGPLPNIKYLYRARAFSSFGGLLDLRRKDSFFYPPSKYCSIGRCNLPNEQVFYCSIIPHTTLFETFREDESLYFISKWKTVNINTVMGMFFLDKANQKIMGNLKRKRIVETGLKENEQLSMRMLDDFYELEFAKHIESEDNYKFLAFTSNRLLKKLGFIAYGSVKQGKGNINITLRKDIADDYLLLDKVFLVKITKINFDDNTNVGFRYLKYGKYDNITKKIEWSEMNKEIFEMENKGLIME